MKVKKIMPIVLSILLLALAISLKAHLPKAVEQQKKQPDKTVTYAKATMPQETRGVWVTYMTLDVENEKDKQSAFEDKIDGIIQDMKQGSFNTMIVQVRPFCDAIYPSKYFPWSHIISSEQGVDPGFDPLAYIVKQCKENGLYVHAWVNPYRISTKNTPASLSKANPYSKDESIGVNINGSLYLNPALEATKELIANGVKELVENYDIDGVQFDDYFYPENCGDFDKADYEAYTANHNKKLTLEEFRKQNVNEMVRAAYQAAHEAKEDIAFGISPQGNLGNNDGLFADVKTWCAEEGYIDYICPQLYFSLDNPALTFEDSLSEWLALKKHDRLKLLIGLSGYKAGTDADDGTWLDNDDILQTEIKILRRSKADGFILYSYDSFRNEENQAEIVNVMRYLTTSAEQ